MRIAQLLVVVACVAGSSACVIESGSRPPAAPPPPPSPAGQPAQPAPANAAAPAPAAPAAPAAATVSLPTNNNTPPAVSNDQGWSDLGSTTVTDGAQASTLAVGSSTAFRVVRFGVDGSSIELRNIVFVFDDGQRFALDARHFIRAGGRSQNITLPGGARVIRQVEYRYQGINPAVHQATVHLYGRAQARLKPGVRPNRRIGQ